MEKTKNKYMIGNILDILICLMLFIMSLYKGAFYKEDSLFPTFVICLIGLGCLIVKIVKNVISGEVVKKSKIVTIIDILVILLPVAYFLPVIFKTYASLESSIFESIRYINFAICYFIARSSKNIKLYAVCFIVISILLSILGVDEITYRCIESITSNISITYLSEQTNNISSTIQYANITAFIIYIGSMLMLNILYKKIPTLGKKKAIRSSMFVGVQIFTYIFLQSSLILTSSRMMIFLSLASIVALIIYHLINKDNKKVILTLGLYIMAFLLVSTIDTLLVTKSYINIYATYFALLIAILSVVVVKHMMITNKDTDLKNKIDTEDKKNIDGKTSIIKKNKLLKSSLYIVAGIIAIVLLFNVESSIILSNNNSENIELSKNMYSYDIGENELVIKILNEESANIIVNLDQTNEDFSRINIYNKKYENVKDELRLKFNVSKGAKRITLNISLTKGKIELGKFKLNDKRVIMSYMFLPDNVVFRLKDTMNFDSNNFLRSVYYKDAVKLFNKSTAIGIGGEGFKLRYQEVQEIPYISSEVHSAPIQIMVESGTIGIVIYSLIITLSVVLIILVFNKNKGIDVYLTVLILISYIIFSSFDLASSFGIIICVFGVLIGIISNLYINTEHEQKDQYTVDNKSWLGNIKMGVMSLFLIILFVTLIYSAKIYFSSMIVLKNYDGEKPTLEETYERIGYMEEKINLDKYNYEYIILLSRTYNEHISNLNIQYINESDDLNKQNIKNEIDNSVIKQKMLYDTLIEYEFYNKYALYEVAGGYFNSYVKYSNIFKEQFESLDVAYSFYLEYAMKLTDRIQDMAKVNELSKNMAKSIYEDSINKLTTDNKYLKSEVINEVIEKIQEKLELI